MTIDVSELMSDADLGATTFTRRRPTVTYAQEGKAVTGYATASLTGIVQPAQDKDAAFLPEGVRVPDAKAFFTSGDVSNGDGKAQLPDLLQYGGETFRVLAVQDFGAHGMRKALAARITVAGGS